MIEILLAVIAACLLFGGGAVLSFFGYVSGVAVILLIVVVGLVLLFLVFYLIGRLFNYGRTAMEAQRKSHPPRIKGCKFLSWEDYIDWANRSGKWADEGRQGPSS
jgi:hypothetical protein